MTPELLDALEPLPAGARAFRDVVDLHALFPGLRPLGSELRRRQCERVAQRLTAGLQAWLDAIKAHLEARPPHPTSPPGGEEKR